MSSHHQGWVGDFRKMFELLDTACLCQSHGDASAGPWWLPEHGTWCPLWWDGHLYGGTVTSRAISGAGRGDRRWGGLACPQLSQVPAPSSFLNFPPRSLSGAVPLPQ